MDEQSDRWLEPDTPVEMLLKKYGEAIHRLYAPESVWLFGSRAIGAGSSESDLDLLVVSRRFAQTRRLRRRSTFLKETDLAQAYELPVVDPLCYTPEEFQTGLHQATIVAEAVASGIRLLGRNDDVLPTRVGKDQV
jgi:predicted nucleotidyltransferase